MTGAQNVFVLTAGRTGSVSFSAACGHITNYTHGHESLADRISEDRFDYPRRHIEIDNRLSWHLGGLARRFPDAAYVHLRRDPEAVARSYLSRWQEPRGPLGLVRHQARLIRPWRSLVAVFGNGIVQRYSRWRESEKIEVSRFMVETINDNISEFLRDKHHMIVDLEDAGQHFSEFWTWIGAEGDLQAALKEWSVPKNGSRNLPLRQW